MPLSINGKVFLNLQEAVAWLLANNALPFQCKVNYVADTEIAKSNIINPSPAEIRIGSLVLFADGKVGTVSGITANGFMVGAESTDLSDGVPHIIGISINASQHLIFTMSEGDPIDAGLVKMVSSLSINASQHLIANYNDGTSTDLGAIFQGTVDISGTLTATHAKVFEQIEDANGHQRFVEGNIDLEASFYGATKTYGRWSLSGSHLMIVVAGTIAGGTTEYNGSILAKVNVPQWVKDKIYPLYNVGLIWGTFKAVDTVDDVLVDIKVLLVKNNNNEIALVQDGNQTFTNSTVFRYQFDLLIDNN